MIKIPILVKRLNCNEYFYCYVYDYQFTKDNHNSKAEDIIQFCSCCSVILRHKEVSSRYELCMC